MKVLLVDDHALIRDALRGVLKELSDDATVLEASDCRQAMRLIEAHPDLHLILLDLNLPDRDGFAVLADLRKRYATISVVVLSAFHDRDNVLRALDLGALGFIPKSAPRDVMVNAPAPGVFWRHLHSARGARPPRAEGSPACPGAPDFAGRSRLYRTPDGGACSHDVWKEQQGDRRKLFGGTHHRATNYVTFRIGPEDISTNGGPVFRRSAGN